MEGVWWMSLLSRDDSGFKELEVELKIFFLFFFHQHVEHPRMFNLSNL